MIVSDELGVAPHFHYDTATSEGIYRLQTPRAWTYRLKTGTLLITI